MATRDEVVTYLADYFPEIDMGGLEQGVLSLSLTSNLGEHAVVVIDFFENELVTLTRPFAAVSSMDPKDALERVRGFGLVEFSGTYAARHVIVMNDLTPSNVGAYIDGLVNDSLRA